MTRRLICLLFLMIGVPSFASATCETDLFKAFHGIPDDSKQGKITDQVPITTPSLIAGYGLGLFPWSVTEQNNGVWYSPPTRGILDFNTMNIPRSDLKVIRKLHESGKFRVVFNSDFRQVITECQRQSRATRVWITDTHIEEFIKLHEAGFAHSVEVWMGDEMVAGMYGVFVKGVFSGESMFHKMNDVTKMAYLALIERMKANGHTFMDTQQNLGLTLKWGGIEISRAEFQERVREAQAADRPF